MRQAASDSDKERGLYFLCMNANISRQFEFVQSNWAANPTFAGLSRDPDPLISADRACPFRATDFALQGTPPRRIHGLPRVVETRGAAYFFMPSRQALQYLASIKLGPPSHAVGQHAFVNDERSNLVDTYSRLQVREQKRAAAAHLL